MTNPRVTRGRRTEANVAAYLRDHGWPHAERVPASIPGSDVRNTPDLSVEVKARAGFNPLAWIKQAAKNADGRLPIAVMRCNGQGDYAGEYVALLRFDDLVDVLLEAGYGDQEAAS